MSKSASARAGVVKSIVAEIRDFCVANADPALVAKYAKFFREGYDAFGLNYKNPGWQANRKSWGDRLRAAGPTAYLEAGDILVRTGKYEEAAFAIEFAADLSDLHTADTFSRLAGWFDGGIRNWAHTDVFCSLVLSRFLVEGIVQLEALAPWVASQHKYQRRAAPVMLIPLLKQSKDHRPLLSLIEPLMSDAAREVQQGAGWFLREAWKLEPKPTEEFLMRYKDSAPRLIFQYATEKMTPAQRSRFRKAR